MNRQRRARSQRLDLARVDIERDHRVADLGEAARGHQADPADTDDADRWLFRRLHGHEATGGYFDWYSRIEVAIESIWPSSSDCSRVLLTQ